MVRKQVPGPAGEPVWGSEIGFRDSAENWNTYLLDDGTVIRIKLVATSIVKVDDLKDSEGNPIYVVQSRNVLAISVPRDEENGH